MKDKFYIIVIIVLAILSICGIYNFFNPIKNLNSQAPIIMEGKILQITKEFEYNENSEYVEKYVAEVFSNKEQYSVNLNNEDIKIYKEKDKVNFYEDRGEYFITKEKATPTNGGIAWIFLSVCEVIAILCLLFNKIR